MASYSIQGSYSTVQVLTPSLVNPIEYVTIQTQPSSVIASIPVQRDVFTSGGAGPELTDFSNAIEQIMARPEVIAGIGSQQLDPNGLLADYVTFTVQYVGPNTASSGVTAEADVRVGMLNFTDGLIGQTLLKEVLAIIAATYNALKAAAAG
jgi:hypothetical protein